MAALISTPVMQMSFAKPSGKTTKGGRSGDSSLGKGDSPPKKDEAKADNSIPDKPACAGCPGYPTDDKPKVVLTDPPMPNPTPTTPGTPTDDGCTDAGPNKCPTPTPPIPDPNGGGTYCPGDSSTHYFKDEKEYARALKSFNFDKS